MELTPEIDLRYIINEMASEYERLNRIKVDLEAREVLIAPALANQAAVDEELSSGKLTVEIIREKVLEQLSIAENSARRRSSRFAESGSGRKIRITADDAEESMREKCALMFWC